MEALELAPVAMAGEILSAEDRVRFMVGGVARFTLRSCKTGQRYTFKVEAPRKDGKLDFSARIRFVKLLSGPDNAANYRYFGMVVAVGNRWVFRHAGAKAACEDSAPSVVAFRWFTEHPGSAALEFFHVGACARCGRDLTVPESITSGFGPICAGKVWS